MRHVLIYCWPTVKVVLRCLVWQCKLQKTDSYSVKVPLGSVPLTKCSALCLVLCQCQQTDSIQLWGGTGVEVAVWITIFV